MAPVKFSVLQIFSHNTQGLNSTVKHQKILQNYHSQKADVVLLQETHFSCMYNPSFVHNKFPNFYLANAQDKIKLLLFSSQNVLRLPHSQNLGS